MNDTKSHQKQQILKNDERNLITNFKMTTTFKPLWWLKNPHLQTIFPTLVKKHLTTPEIRKQRIELDDGDFLDLIWADAKLTPCSPLVILLHGVGGGIHSSYAKILMNELNNQGFRAALLHFRGAGFEANRLPRTYHAGDTKDLDTVIELIVKQEPNTNKAIVGISLGGNVLLKWLGEKGNITHINKAVAVSVPFQLEILVNKLNQGFSKIYQTYLLSNLRRLYNRKQHITPYLNSKVLAQLKTFWQFDQITTAPLHGFESAKHYYQSVSCVPYLKHIKVPTLIIHALDDPFMTPECIPDVSQLSDTISLEITSSGGHVGFIEKKKIARPAFWLASKIPSYLNDLL